jgi:hypothetical protein
MAWYERAIFSSYDRPPPLHWRLQHLQPIMAFDDRDEVVKMWKSKSIPCAQIAEGSI